MKIHKIPVSLIILLLTISTTSCSIAQNATSTTTIKTSEISTNLKWSERMTLSEIHRFPDPTFLDFTTEPKWNYTNGFVLQAMYQVYLKNKDPKIMDYINQYGEKMINAKGEILTYDKEKYSLDLIKSGDAIFDIYSKTGNEKYKIALTTLFEQLHHQPTTSEGGYWHKKVYPYQMWLDGVYMAEPFKAKYTQKFLKGKEADQSYDKIALQFDLIEKYNRDPKTGLYFHGWDEKKEQKWADPKTGLSQHSWSRGMGWYGMALVDVLDYLPKENKNRQKLIQYLNQFAEAIVKVQDQSGTWYQVLDQGNRQGNYLEATGSAMFTYTLIKAVNKGYIPKTYLKPAEKGYQGILNEFIKVDENGIVNLEKCCAVAGLGGNPYRDGSFEYYINEPIRANDPKGTAAFILASLEFNK